jgi:phosphatidylglycerophosphate synthase
MIETAEVSSARNAAAGRDGRILGLRVSERNRRVGERVARLGGRLEIPPGVMVAPALVSVLPDRPGLWHLRWDPERPPLAWNVGPDSAPSAAATIDVPPHAVVDVSTREARRRSARLLLQASGKPTDGWMSRHVHRKVSRACSVPALWLGVTANQATLAVFGVGLAAAWYFAQTGRATMALGGLLFWMTSVLDGVDGEIARLTLTESAAGAQLDTVVDDLTYAACYAGVMVGWWRQGMGAAGFALVAGTFAALGLTVLWATRMVKRSGPPSNARFVALTPIELAVVDAARGTGKRGLRFAASFFQIFRRELFSIALFAASLLTAWRGVLPLTIAGGLVVALGVLVTYRGDLEAAMRARFRG